MRAVFVFVFLCVVACFHPSEGHQFVGGVCNLVISVDCSLNYSHHKYNTKYYNRAKEME